MNPWLAYILGICTPFAVSTLLLLIHLRTYKRTGKSWLMGG